MGLSRLPFARFATVAALAASAALAACGDSTAPATGTFNPAQASASLSAAAAAKQSPAFASFSALGGAFAATGAVSPMIARSGSAATSFDAARMARALPSFHNGAPPALPPSSLGKTYTWDVSTKAYAVSARSGAPSNGVRFVLYAVNPVTDLPVEPLSELGYADVIDVGSAATTGVRVLVVSGGVTYLDYTVAGAGSASGASATITGFVTNGTERANFTVTASAVSNPGGGVTLNVDYSLSLPQRGATLVTKFSLTGQAGTATGTVDVALTGDGHVVAMAGSFNAGSGTLDVKVDGQPFATVSGAFGTPDPVITGADGKPLSAEHAAVLKQIFDLLDDAGDFFEKITQPTGAFH